MQRNRPSVVSRCRTTNPREGRMLGIGALELDRVPDVTDRIPADPRRPARCRAASSGPGRGRHASHARGRRPRSTRAFGERIRRYIAFRVRSPEDAEDLTSDVLSADPERPRPDRPGAPGRPGCSASPTNAIVDHYRRRRFTIPLLGILERPDDAPSLPDRAVRDEEVRTVDPGARNPRRPPTGPRSLPAFSTRTSSYADIATVMGIPAVTAADAGPPGG